MLRTHSWSFNAALQSILKVTLKLEFIMIASMVKLKAFQRYVFAVMVWLLVWILFLIDFLKDKLTLSYLLWILDII